MILNKNKQNLTGNPIECWEGESTFLFCLFFFLPLSLVADWNGSISWAMCICWLRAVRIKCIHQTEGISAKNKSFRRVNTLGFYVPHSAYVQEKQLYIDFFFYYYRLLVAGLSYHMNDNDEDGFPSGNIQSSSSWHPHPHRNIYH